MQRTGSTFGRRTIATIGASSTIELREICFIRDLLEFRTVSVLYDFRPALKEPTMLLMSSRGSASLHPRLQICRASGAYIGLIIPSFHSYIHPLFQRACVRRYADTRPWWLRLRRARQSVVCSNLKLLQCAKRKALSKAERKKYSPHMTLSSMPSFLRS
jgi:hypothetical protein